MTTRKSCGCVMVKVSLFRMAKTLAHSQKYTSWQAQVVPIRCVDAGGRNDVDGNGGSLCMFARTDDPVRGYLSDLFRGCYACSLMCRQRELFGVENVQTP